MKATKLPKDLVPHIPKALSDRKLKRAWKDFLARYPTKKKCLAEIRRILLASGLILCRECKGKHFKKLSERRLKCGDCKTKRSVTAGTFFDHMRACRAWLAAIWFANKGILISSSIFQKLLNIAHSSARYIQKRILTALQRPMQDDLNTLLVPTAAFIKLFRRRSFETHARQSPKSETAPICSSQESWEAKPAPAQLEARDHDPHDQATPASQPTPEPQTEDTSEPLSDDQQTLLDVLSDKPVSISQISGTTELPIWQINAGLSMLEAAGLCRRLPGNQYVATTKEDADEAAWTPDDRATESIARSSDFLVIKFNGLSRKHLQKYLVAHWLSVVKSRRHSTELCVMQACLRLGKKTSKEIFADITPAVVRVALATA